MKRLLLTALLLTGSAFAGEVNTESASKLALIGGVALNIVGSFQPQHFDCSTQWTANSPCRTQPLMFTPGHFDLGTCTLQCFPTAYVPGMSYVLVARRPIGRTIGLSAGTVGALVAEHYIGKKFPRSKRWLALVNFSVGGAMAYQGVR